MKLDDVIQIREKVTVAIPFAEGEAVMRTVSAALANDWADFLFIGNREKTVAEAKRLELDVDACSFIEAVGEEEACRLTAEALHAGTAQTAMKGLVHTGEFSRALFNKSNGLLENGSLVSHLALCSAPAYHKPFFMTDCAINITPSYEDKYRILNNAVEMTLRLGIEAPKVGLIAPVETVSEKISATVDAVRLKTEYKDCPTAVLDGPFGLDVALSAEAARIKKIDSLVAGDPDILLFPDLNSANAVYKAVTILGGATIAGILVGLKAPVVVSSRSDDAETKLLSLKLGIALAGQAAACD